MAIDSGRLRNTGITQEFYIYCKILEFLYIFTRLLEKYWKSLYILAWHVFSFKNLRILSFFLVLRYLPDFGSVKWLTGKLIPVICDTGM